MTMPKFEPVAHMQVSVEEGVDTYFPRLHKPEKYNADWWRFDPLHSADQLTEAYEAGKREQDAELEAARAEIENVQLVSQLHYDANLSLRQQLATAKSRINQLEQAIDQEMVVCHLGVFNSGDDPVKAIKDLMLWSQGVGEYFAKEGKHGS